MTTPTPQHDSLTQQPRPKDLHLPGQAALTPATIKTNTTIPDTHAVSMLNNVIAVSPIAAQFRDRQPCSIS
jgi:hypothetical protein